MEPPALLQPPAGPGARLAAAARLMRPANALTAAADALAGLAVAWGLTLRDLPPGLWLLPLAAFLLYAGGVALNDVCDADRDRLERPERPIPRGHIARPAALHLACGLLAGGVFLAALFSLPAALVAIVVVHLVVAYDTVAKHSPWLGPLVMGLCRAGSLLLGMTADLGSLGLGWPLAAVPLAYVVAITLVSRGEADGRNTMGYGALILVVLVAVAYGFLAISRDQWPALLFVALFATLAWPAFVDAAVAPSVHSVRGAVKAGVLCLVILDAALAAVYAGPVSALALLLLLPLSRGLARFFPVA